MKKIVTLLTGLVFIFFGFYLYGRINQSINQSTEKQIAEKISVQQSVTVKEKPHFKIYQVDKGFTAFDLLRKYKEAEAKGEGKNAYVISIDGIKALSEKREYWAFYVNGKASQVGAGSYQLKDGDKIEWKIEKY